MKTKILSILCITMMCGWQMNANAQEGGDRQGRGDFSGHWQIGIPLGSPFADASSGWGANFEAHYFVTNQIAIGGFISWQTFIEYKDRQTYQLSNDAGQNKGAVTLDQYHTTYELPFGASARYHFLSNGGIIDPYIGVKLGANYSTMRRYYNIFEDYDENWGFTVLPELGVMILPSSVGFHFAVFYDYATNKSGNSAIDVSGLSSLGFRVGVNFRF